ncbi:hypothetical protein [Brachybacterium halotolerans]|uniref:hypothetical protein n=1 Tax=Brachybacterium halotolerans TaxID=2795215 RepID=UPI003CCD548D
MLVDSVSAGIDMHDGEVFQLRTHPAPSDSDSEPALVPTGRRADGTPARYAVADGENTHRADAPAGDTADAPSDASADADEKDKGTDER